MRCAEDFSPEILRTLRRERGLTQARLAFLCGICKDSIYEYEAGRRHPSPDIWERVKQVLSGKVKSFPRLKRTAPKAVVVVSFEKVIPANPEFEFETGHSYTIRSMKSGTKPVECSGSVHVDMMSVFMYEGKQGIHHCFRETRGGWTRTYTDAQLIGKHVEEVQE